MSFGREDPEMKRVHQQMKDYLTQEEEAVEDRIRYGYFTLEVRGGRRV